MIVEIPYIFLQAVLFLIITYPTINFYWSIYKVFWYFILNILHISLLQLLWNAACIIDPNIPTGFNIGKFLLHHAEFVLRLCHSWTSNCLFLTTKFVLTLTNLRFLKISCNKFSSCFYFDAKLTFINDKNQEFTRSFIFIKTSNNIEL